MKSDVGHVLDHTVRLQIAHTKNIIKPYLHNAHIYLFGSIAKGCYSKNSDIDLLILIPEEMTTKELRSLRHHLEDTIEEYNINRAVDLKLYTTARYTELSQKPCFERAIVKDLINIEEWWEGG